MPIFVLTGRARDIKRRWIDRIHCAQKRGEHALLVVVPAQYTLQAELDILSDAGAAGSFRLQVLSPTRLYQRIFEQAGWPPGARIDQQGRVMLVHSVARRQSERLGWYRGAVGRKGFAEKMLAQIEDLKQSNVSPERVRQWAEEQTGALKAKLSDIAFLYEAYEDAVKGRFLDGEDEARQAALRMDQAPLLNGAEVFVYGFDALSALLTQALLALSTRARALTIALTLDEGGRDADLFTPMLRSYRKLEAAAREQGMEIRREIVPPSPAYGAEGIRHLERELLCVPANSHQKAADGVEFFQRGNPQEEAEYAAALTRELVMERGWRWRDIAVVCQTLDETYVGALRRAFAQSGVPLFLPVSRPADRHPISICLLSALRVLSRGWQTQDMVDYLRSGLAPLSDEEADTLVNHILRRGLRGRALKSELRALPEGALEIEFARARAVAPLLALEAVTAKKRDTRLILGAVFSFLESLDACAQLEAQRQSLIALGQREWAMEGAQAWNRILLAMDQMYDLLGDDALSLGEVGELLSRSLAVAEVKPLPQSGDAVLCGSMDHMKSQQVRALMVLGLNDQPVSDDAGLLSGGDLERIGADREWSGSLSATDRRRMARLSMKSALSFTESYLLLSHPGSDAKGAALQRGVLFEQARRIMGNPAVRGGSQDEESLSRVLLNAREAAENRVSAALNRRPASPYALAVRRALGALPPRGGAETVSLPPDLAEGLFSGLKTVSATQLERYKECPYKHFVRYALNPEPFEEFGLTTRDAGTFYHEAMERFMRENADQMQALTPEQSMEKMDGITDRLMDELRERALGEGAVADAEAEDLRQVARRAAATAVRQLEGSRFRTAGVEIRFGQDDDALPLPGGARLTGRIDRMDEFEGEDAVYLRVIDYKTHGKAFNLAETYYGLQMQLMIYLAAAVRKRGGKPAGAFYFTLSDKPVETDARNPEQVERERMKELRLRGLAAKDARVVSAMARDPSAAMMLRDAQWETEEFEMLIEHTMRRASEAYADLRSGVIEARPSVLGGKSGCDYCEYSSLCQLELRPKSRALPRLKPKEAMEKIRETHERRE